MIPLGMWDLGILGFWNFRNLGSWELRFLGICDIENLGPWKFGAEQLID